MREPTGARQRGDMHCTECSYWTEDGVVADAEQGDGYACDEPKGMDCLGELSRQYGVSAEDLAEMLEATEEQW